MNKRLAIIWFVLFLFLSMFTLFAGYAQESEPPQKVATSVGIYDIKSRDEIHKFSAREIRKLVQMENGARPQHGAVPPHPVFLHCFEERTFRYTGGNYENEEVRYRLHTPKRIMFGRKYPLVLHLHGYADGSLTHLHPIMPILIGPEQQDCFVLVPQAPKEWTKERQPDWSFKSTEDGTLDVAMAALEHVVAENPIDKKRISVTGISSGGWAVWQLLLRHPDMFAGAVPTSCGAPSELVKLAALKKTRIWAFINKGDISPESLQRAKSMINGSGGSMEFTELDVPAHNAFVPAIQTHDCFRWALAQKKGSWFSPPPGTVVHQPNSLLFILFIYILPLAIIIYLSWEIICEWGATAYQSTWKWLGKI